MDARLKAFNPMCCDVCGAQEAICFRLTCLQLASRSSEVGVLQEMGLEHGATSNAKFSGPELEAGADDPRVLRRG
jgi:hypothetical protein